MFAEGDQDKKRCECPRGFYAHLARISGADNSTTPDLSVYLRQKYDVPSRTVIPLDLLTDHDTFYISCNECVEGMVCDNSGLSLVASDLTRMVRLELGYWQNKSHWLNQPSGIKLAECSPDKFGCVRLGGNGTEVLTDLETQESCLDQNVESAEDSDLDGVVGNTTAWMYIGACPGGSNWSQCSPAYSGVRCGLCSPGYVRDADGETCLWCSGGTSTNGVVIVSFGCVVMLFLIALVMMLDTPSMAELPARDDVVVEMFLG